MTDWIDTLISVPKEALADACRTYLRDQPRRRPTPGDIRARAFGWMKAKGYAQAPRIETERPQMLEGPKAERVSAETAKHILADSPYTPKRFGAVKRHRMARSEAELYGDAPDQRRHIPGPRDDDELRRARMANPLMRAAMGVEDDSEGAA